MRQVLFPETQYFHLLDDELHPQFCIRISKSGRYENLWLVVTCFFTVLYGFQTS